MPKCLKCHTFYCHASMSGPAEECECGGNYTKADLRREWFEEYEPTEDELERIRDRARFEKWQERVYKDDERE